MQLFHAADANNPVWTYVDTGYPSGPGGEAYSFTFTLPQGGVQAFRALAGNLGYDVSWDACPDPYYYDDADDVVFAVGSATP